MCPKGHRDHSQISVVYTTYIYLCNHCTSLYVTKTSGSRGFNTVNYNQRTRSVVWYGMVWCGVVWLVWCGVVWYGMVWCGVVWYGVVWCGVWCGVVTTYGGMRQWPYTIIDSDNGANPLSQPTLDYCKCVPWEPFFFAKQYNDFHTMKWKWKCRQQSSGHFFLGINMLS